MKAIGTPFRKGVCVWDVGGNQPECASQASNRLGWPGGLARRGGKGCAEDQWDNDGGDDDDYDDELGRTNVGRKRGRYSRCRTTRE